MKYDFDSVREEICDVLEINQGNVPDEEFQKFVLDIIEKESEFDENFITDFSQEARMWIFCNMKPRITQKEIKKTKVQKKLNRKKMAVNED